MFKNTLIVTLLASTLAFSAVADNNTNSTSLFAGNELGVSLSTVYAPYTDYDANLSAGLSYFATKNLGLALNAPFYSDGKGKVGSASLDAIVRLPVLDVKRDLSIAVYGIGGVENNWDEASYNETVSVRRGYKTKLITVNRDTAQWQGRIGAGIEARTAYKTSVFLEYVYQFDNLTSKFNEGTSQVRAGIKVLAW